MNDQEAKRIVDSIDPEKGVATIPDWLKWSKAEGFLEAYTAAQKREAKLKRALTRWAARWGRVWKRIQGLQEENAKLRSAGADMHEWIANNGVGAIHEASGCKAWEEALVESADLKKPVDG